MIVEVMMKVCRQPAHARVEDSFPGHVVGLS